MSLPWESTNPTVTLPSGSVCTTHFSTRPACKAVSTPKQAADQMPALITLSADFTHSDLLVKVPVGSDQRAQIAFRMDDTPCRVGQVAVAVWPLAST